MRLKHSQLSKLKRDPPESPNREKGRLSIWEFEMFDNTPAIIYIIMQLIFSNLPLFIVFFHYAYIIHKAN